MQRNAGPIVRWGQDPANLLLLLGLVSGLVLVFLLPPYQVADEWGHFFRAWQLAEGKLLGSGLGDYLPANLQRFNWEIESFFGIPTRQPVPWQETVEFLRGLAALRIDVPDVSYVIFPTVLYAPVPYLGMTTAIALGRLVTDSPLLLMYLGRLGGLCLALTLTWYAIRRAPFGKWALFLMAMTPVIAFQRAGMSADGFINALAMLHVALVMELACEPGRKVRAVDLFRLGIVTVVLCLCKQAYLILPLLHIVIPRDRFSRPGDARLARYWLPVLGWVTAVWWAATVMRENYEPMKDGCDAIGQLRWILVHPLQYLLVLGRDLAEYGYRYLHEMIGTLGWLDIPAANWLVLTHALVLAIVVLTADDCRERLTPFIRGWSVFILITSLGFVLTLMYLWWAPVGDSNLPGMQGRYFAPFLPLLLLIFAGLWPRRAMLPAAAPRVAPHPAGPWPWLLGGYGLFLTLETLYRVLVHHYR